MYYQCLTIYVYHRLNSKQRCTCTIKSLIYRKIYSNSSYDMLLLFTIHVDVHVNYIYQFIILINYRYWKLTFSFNFLLPNLIGLPDCKIFVRETLLICLVLYIYDRLLHILCQSLFYQLKVNYSRKSVNIFKIPSYNVIIPWPSF